jgi:hypothetical protein
MKEKPTVQKTSTMQTSFDARIESWGTEIRSVQKRVGRRQALGAIGILVGIFLLWLGLSFYGTTVAVIGAVAIVGAALLLIQASNIRFRTVKRLTSEIQRACQDEGLEKKDVVKTLFQLGRVGKTSGQTRNEILRAVDPGTFRVLIKREADEAIAAIGRSRHVPVGYFESRPPEGDGRCSDNECPCPSPGTPISRGQGFLYIPPRVVEMRRDARTLDALYTKMKRAAGRDELVGDFRSATVVPRQGLYHPILMCRQGAERRGIDLEVAAKDAAYWWKTGLVPLRPTPAARA